MSVPAREALAAAAWAVGAALLAWRARRDSTDWVPSSRFHWESLRAAMAQLAAKDLLLITDFDATLTTGDSEQCHDIVGSSKVMSDAFLAEFAPLLDWTSNAAIDGVEWWDRAHELMIEHGMPRRALIPRLVREAKTRFRPGALEMLKQLELANVPVLIVSAGLADVIEEFLRQYGAFSENVTICSNRLNYSADSAPKSVSPSPPITSFTKEYAYSSASSFFAQHKTRRGIIQLGDSLTDVDPAKKVPYDQLLSVGFLNARPDGRKHAETFDAVVIGNEGSLAPVTDLLNDIIGGSDFMRRLTATSPTFRRTSAAP
jgi:5'-nucleotidase